MRTVTDKKGNFEFPQLTPGDYHIWTDSSSEQWVSAQPLPMTIPINAGEQKEIRITFTHPASLQGEILLEEFLPVKRELRMIDTDTIHPTIR
jgi:uncharacterized surface anchored protein